MAALIRGLAFVSLLAAQLPLAAAQAPARVTVLYDAFGRTSELQKDWGFAALVEYGGKRILFDTGNNARIFEHNVRALKVDLTRLDAAVVSHRHGDHTSGLNYLVQVNPRVKIYTPIEGAYFKSPLPAAFLQPAVASLPPNMRYFDGRPPAQIVSGTPWEQGDFQGIAKTTEIFPGFWLIPTRSEKPGTVEMNELSLAIRTPKGLAVVVGCSHPGVERILAEAVKLDPKLFTVTGGFHLVTAPEADVRRVADTLADTLHVERVAPGHCTSELAFSIFMERFKDRFDAAGLGAVIALP